MIIREIFSYYFFLKTFAVIAHFSYDRGTDSRSRKEKSCDVQMVLPAQIIQGVFVHIAFFPEDTFYGITNVCTVTTVCKKKKKIK